MTTNKEAVRVEPMTEVKPLSGEMCDVELFAWIDDRSKYSQSPYERALAKKIDATITALKSENEKLRGALRSAEEVMTDFLENPLYQVGVGENPNRVERMINNSRVALSSARAALAKETK